jgi:hypothetical protein
LTSDIPFAAPNFYFTQFPEDLFRGTTFSTHNFPLGFFKKNSTIEIDQAVEEVQVKNRRSIACSLLMMPDE